MRGPGIGKAVRAGLDGHAHAGDGRVCAGGTNTGEAGAVNGHHHDAYLGGPPGGCGTLPGAGSFRVSIEADTAIRIARGGCQSAWGQGTEGRDSVDYTALVAGCS